MAVWHAAVHRDRVEGKPICTFGLHPGPVGHANCEDGAYGDRQCCILTPCRVHKCGPRKGCRCPLPEGAT